MLSSRDARNLTVIANDTARPGVGVGKLISAGCVARVIASHIGTNPETQRLMIAGEIEIELVPQGTLAERIRAGGAGLGGVLTETGLGTAAGDGRMVVQVEGRDFLVEPALKADVALVAARSADYIGNLVYSLTARNFKSSDGDGCEYNDRRGQRSGAAGSALSDGIHTPGVGDRLSGRAAANQSEV